MAPPPLLALLDAARSGSLHTGTQRSMRWEDVAGRARALAHLWFPLANQRVGLQVPSGEDFVVSLFGLLGAGATVVPITPQTPANAVISRFRIQHVITAADAVFPRQDWPVAPWGKLALLTSGTTGEPAAALLSQQALVANARAIAASLNLTAADTTLCVPPFHHAYGLSVLLSHLCVDASVVVEADSAFPATLLQTAAFHHATGLSAVPTTWQLLCRRDLLATDRPPSLRLATVAGGALPQAALKTLRSSLGSAGLCLMYGQTEACARLTCLPPDELDAAPTSCGRPIPGVELRISPSGEVLARGPNLMDGYLDDPVRTAAALQDGWLHTGDLGMLDGEGRLHLTGRLKNMLKVAGHRVAPLHVENVLSQVEGVEAVAVVGMPDALLGEVPVAFVVGPVTSEALTHHAARALQPHERPRRFVSLLALPRLPGGKPDLQALRALAAQG